LQEKIAAETRSTVIDRRRRALQVPRARQHNEPVAQVTPSAKDEYDDDDDDRQLANLIRRADRDILITERLEVGLRRDCRIIVLRRRFGSSCALSAPRGALAIWRSYC
jgi:hypothetical protein